MEYNNLFEPLLCIFLVLILGILIGCISALWVGAKEMKEVTKELDKFRELYFDELDKFKNKYDNDDEYEAY